MKSIRLHQFARSSFANGPGERAVVWVQGCTLQCSGCFNPSTHDRDTGFEVNPLDLANTINTLPVRGVTITGGEPLLQSDAVDALVSAIDPAKDVLLYSGFSVTEIKSSAPMRRVLARVDAALLGRYDPSAAHPYAAKQLVLRTGRLQAFEFEPTRHIEVNIDATKIVVTGFPFF